MENNKEFLELKNVSDYWAKTLWEYENLQRNQNNVYVAFNFIVTVWHLTDWYFKAINPEDTFGQQKVKMNNFVSSNPIVEISEHLANGAKHFELTAKKHKSVKSTQKERYVQKGYWEEDYTEDPITIYLNKDFHSKFGESVKLQEYSKNLIEFWNQILKSADLI